MRLSKSSHQSRGVLFLFIFHLGRLPVMDYTLLVNLRRYGLLGSGVAGHSCRVWE